MITAWKKNVVLFLTSQTVSLFGSSLVQYAIIWHITLTTQSGAMMTISTLCGFLPTFILSPFAGVWADRFNRKLLMVLSDSMIAIATLALAILFMTGHNEIWLLFVVLAIRGMGAGIQTPAVGAFLPQIVPVEKLTRVNAINGTIQSMILLASPMLSGALYVLLPLQYIFFIDVVTAGIAVTILLIFLRVPAHAKALARQTVSYFADMLKGFKYIRNHTYLIYYFVFCMLFFFLAAPVALLTPLQVTRTFGSDAWRLSAIEVAFSAGMIVGGLIMAAWKGFKNRVRTMTMASLFIGGCTIALGVIPDFWVYLGFMVLTGVAMPVFNTPSTVMLQEKVEEEYMGRVFSILGMIATSMMPLGMVVFGPLADSIKIEWMLIGTGILMVVVGCFLIGNKVLVEAGKPTPKPELTTAEEK